MVFCLLLHSFIPSLKSQDISKLIDSINTQNLYAHDTVKIKNYILIHENLQGRDLDTSLYFIDKALKIDSLSEESDQRAYLLLLKGQILMNGHKYTNAIDIYYESLKIAKRENKKTINVENYYSLNILLANMNMLDEAFTHLMTALRQSSTNKNTTIYAEILTGIGYTFQLQGKYIKGLEYFRKAYQLYTSMKDLDGMAASANNMGAMFFAINNLDSVQHYYNLALELYEKLGNKKNQSFPISNLGESYFESENYDKAIEYFRKAYEIDKEFNDKLGMSISLHFLGKVYSAKGHYNYGLILYEQALDISKEINDLFEMKDIYLDISDNYAKLNKYQKALTYFQLHSQLKDSIFDIETSNKILELETQYQTEQQQSENELQRLKIQRQEDELQKQLVQKLSLIGGLILLLIISVIIYRNYHLKNKSNALLVKQKQQIENQNNKITASIQYAKLIQTAALPPYELLRNIFNHHFVLFLPRDIVSGDFFWATKKDEFSVIACADCTGHGVPGAFMSMLGVSFLTEIVNRTEKLSANKILEDLRHNIIESLHQTGKIGESRDGMDIALCIINHDKTQLEYAGAFIPLVIVRDNNIIQITADKMPIGVHDETLAPFTSHKAKLQKDDMLYLFTDGYADQFGGPFNKKFKMQPFLSLLLAQHAKPLVQQREVLYETIMSWKGENEQVDDILIMGFRV